MANQVIRWLPAIPTVSLALFSIPCSASGFNPSHLPDDPNVVVQDEEGGWTMMALIFTIVILLIVLVGSLWVMYHLNANMMPMSPEMMKNMP